MGRGTDDRSRAVPVRSAGLRGGAGAGAGGAGEAGVEQVAQGVAEHVHAVRRVTRYPKLRRFLKAHEAGTLLRGLRARADVVSELPQIRLGDDPGDNLVLATALAGDADYLVTGDRRHLLKLKSDPKRGKLEVPSKPLRAVWTPWLPLPSVHERRLGSNTMPRASAPS